MGRFLSRLNVPLGSICFEDWHPVSRAYAVEKISDIAASIVHEVWKVFHRAQIRPSIATYRDNLRSDQIPERTE